MLLQVQATAVKELVFPICAAVAWLALIVRGTSSVFRVVNAKKAPRGPAEAVLLTVFFVLGAVFATSTPSVSADLDRLTGVPNLTALVIHCSIVMYSVAIQVLVLLWAHPLKRALPMIRRRVLFFALVLISMITLFLAAGSTRGIRVEDFLLHYADRPLIAAYLTIFLIALIIGLVAIMQLCLRYSRVAGNIWLRRGLRISAVASALGLGYCACRIGTAVSGLLGLPRGIWELGVALFGGIGGILGIIGLTIPAWGPRLAASRGRLERYHAYYQLYPLWAAVSHAVPEVILSTGEQPAIARFALKDLDFRLYRRVIEI